MSIDLDKLERLARAATPGPWGGSSRIVYADLGDGDMEPLSQVSPHARDRETASYIAGASPDVVLELIAEVRRLRFCVNNGINESDLVEQFEGSPGEPR